MRRDAAAVVLSVSLLLTSGVTTRAQEASPAPAAEPQAQHDARMGWFRDARFGLFIHWGVYAVPAGEYQGQTGLGEWFLEETKMPVSQYEQFARQFNPTKFDARAWARAAKDAGMKYVVITSKHHDGFGLWPSDQTDWCIKATPFAGRDPLQELAEACRAEGLTFCLYHSIMDWHHPDWGKRRPWNDRAGSEPPDMDRFTAYLKAQLQEIVSRYHPGILWFDGQWEDCWTTERGHDLFTYVRSLQPGIIINNRVGKGDVGDYGTPEQTIPARGFGPGVDWESCMTMNGHWGYNKHDQNWKSTTTLIRNLIDCASKGGNYLLNVGPTAEGLIPEPSLERLAAIGAWMKVNGEAIDGTSASPFGKLPWGRATQKPGKVYLFVYDWPKDGLLTVPLVSPVRKASLLAHPSAVLPAMIARSSEAGEPSPGLSLRLPPQPDNEHATVVVLDIEGTPVVSETLGTIQQSADGSATLTAAEAETHGQLHLEGPDESPNIGFWVNPADTLSWDLAVSRPGSYRVKAELAAMGDSQVAVRVGGQSVTAHTPRTGDYKTYQTVDLGTVELPAKGKTTVGLEPVKERWSPINVRKVVLVPIP
jgi:alpha-L-fucosidase